MNIIGIYPVSAQPPHYGHYRAYEFLKKITGKNTFVATSDDVELPKAPLNFQDKQQIWARHGVPIDKVVKTKNPQKALEITQKFGTDRTVAIFAMSQKDSETSIKNSNGYFLKFRGMAGNLQPLNKNAYILTIPNELLYLNKSLSSVTFRQAFGSERLSIEQKKSFFKQVFGWYDISLFELISKKFAEAHTVKERVNEVNLSVFRRTLRPFIKEILGQLTSPQGSDETNSSALPDDLSPADAAKATRLKKDAESKKLKEKQKELDYLKKKDDIDKKMAKQKISGAQDDIKVMKAV